MEDKYLLESINKIIDLADGKTLSELTSNINEQLSKWIRNDYNIQVDGQYVNSNNNQYKNLVLYFSISTEDNSNVFGEDNTELFALFLTNDLKNKKIISKLEL